jgi:hypothetical protein
MTKHLPKEGFSHIPMIYFSITRKKLGEMGVGGRENCFLLPK